MKKPEKGTYPSYYENYLVHIVDDDPIKQLEAQTLELKNVIKHFDEETANYAYAEEKWTVKEVIGHLLDTERVLAYRAMCIARGETKNLPGFDENKYVKAANFNRRNLSDLMNEYINQRNSTISLFRSFNNEIIDRIGIANDHEITVRAIIFIVTAHEKHHIEILEKRYLPLVK